MINRDEILKSLIGMNKEDAFKLCRDNEFVIRVNREDSDIYCGTMDLNFDRINLQIDNGVITECNFG
jgi:hypothetical protein